MSKRKLERFLAFIEETCPWFLEEGTVNLETWAKVGEQIQTAYTLHGPDRVPLDAYSLWTLFEPRTRKQET